MVEMRGTSCFQNEYIQKLDVFFTAIQHAIERK
jgi:hypothetical protein